MEQISVKASYQITIFHNEQNHYRVAKFLPVNSRQSITVTGIMPVLHKDHLYELSGCYVEHPRYGMQFQLHAYQVRQPSEKDALIRYFSSSLFPGIGKKSAEQLVEALGEDAIAKIKADAAILDHLPASLKKHKYVILNGIEEQNGYSFHSFFVGHGLSLAMAQRIENHYGEQAVALVKENPYRLVYEIDGIGFANADKLAQALHYPSDSIERAQAYCLSVLMERCMRQGDSFLWKEELVEAINQKNELYFDVDACLEELAEKKLIVMEGTKLFHHTQYEAECGIASFLSHFPYDDTTWECSGLIEAINEVEKELHVTYDETQKEAIRLFFEEPLLLLSGGPGTGKTTIVKGILQLYKRFYPNGKAMLCAPTGRAAKRLSELSDAPASTIHRLLRWNITDNTFEVNEQHPIDADVLFIDEFSMVDNCLFYHLLCACGHVQKLVLIGDENQLESVGCGTLLKDLIAAKCFPFIRLHHIYRQAEGSEVIELAHGVLEGQEACLKNGRDVAFFPCENFEVKDQIIKIVAHALEKGYDPCDMQVIAPMYQGVAGIDALNHALQKLCNPSETWKREVHVGNRIFREGDRILQLKNQVEDNVYNGDIGEIIEIETASENALHETVITASFDDAIVSYRNEQFSHITHAYCISVHKAQGSEYPIVILPIVYDYRYLLSRRLLYTAITRAKQAIVLLGSEDAFYYAGSTNERHQRKTALVKRLVGSNEEEKVPVYDGELQIIE